MINGNSTQSTETETEIQQAQKTTAKINKKRKREQEIKSAIDKKASGNKKAKTMRSEEVKDHVMTDASESSFTTMATPQSQQSINENSTPASNKQLIDTVMTDVSESSLTTTTIPRQHSMNTASTKQVTDSAATKAPKPQKTTNKSSPPKIPPMNEHRNLTCAIPVGSGMISAYSPPYNRILFYNSITNVTEVLCNLPTDPNESQETYRDFIQDCKLHLNGTTLYASNNRAHCVYVIDFNERKLLFTIGKPGKSGFVDGTEGLLANPCGIWPMKNSDLWIADLGNNSIRRFNWTTRSLTTLCGQPRTDETFSIRDGGSDVALFSAPVSVCVEPVHEAYVYVADSHCIRSIHIESRFVTTICGGMFRRGWADGKGLDSLFFQPTALTIDYNGKLIVADTGNKTLRVVDLKTNEVSTIQSPIPLKEPVSLTTHRITGELVVTDRKRRSIHYLKPTLKTGSISTLTLEIPEHQIWRKMKLLIRLLTLTRPITKQGELKKAMKEIDDRKFKSKSNVSKQKVLVLITRSIAQIIGVADSDFKRLLIAYQGFMKDSYKKPPPSARHLNIIPQTPTYRENGEVIAAIPPQKKPDTNNNNKSISVGDFARETLRNIVRSILPVMTKTNIQQLTNLKNPPDVTKSRVWVVGATAAQQQQPNTEMISKIAETQTQSGNNVPSQNQDDIDEVSTAPKTPTQQVQASESRQGQTSAAGRGIFSKEQPKPKNDDNDHNYHVQPSSPI